MVSQRKAYKQKIGKTGLSSKDNISWEQTSKMADPFTRVSVDLSQAIKIIPGVKRRKWKHAYVAVKKVKK